MKIEIIAPTRIEVDGADAGLPLDYFLAHPEHQAAVRQAFIDWHASHVTATAKADADRDAAIAKVRAEAGAECDKHRDIAAKATADRDSAQAALHAAFAALSAHPVIAGNQKAKALRDAQAKADEAAAALKALQG